MEDRDTFDLYACLINDVSAAEAMFLADACANDPAQYTKTICIHYKKQRAKTPSLRSLSSLVRSRSAQKHNLGFRNVHPDYILPK